MRRLNTALQRYAWGKSGSNSMVAQLKQTEDEAFDVDEGETYAELWMGTHPNGPSRVMREGHEETDELQGLSGSPEAPGMFLIELLETYPHYLGDQEDLGDLPFMFKVLSINKALSIQAHPDKKLAERLYATRPDLYKDDNHKPEMAVALSDFEGLCGFRPFEEIIYNLETYPELRAAIGVEATAQALSCTSGVKAHEEDALRAMFRAFVTANTDVVSAQVSALVNRLKSESLPAAAASEDGESYASNATWNHFPATCGGSGCGGYACCGRCNGLPNGNLHAHARGPRCSGRQQAISSSIGEEAYDDEVVVVGIEQRGLESMDVKGQVPASSGSEDTIDGTTDHEDPHTEDDSCHPHSDGNGSNCSSSSSSSSRSRSSSERSSSRRRGRHGVADNAIHGLQHRAAGRHEAAMAAATGAIPLACARRRGWSSSALMFADVTGRRRAREDLALRQLILRLSDEYPGDIGIMMPLLLNYLRMGEGESFFMAANEPHAYLKGDILEVMARSDNVVRVALTPKHRDVPLLCEILTYRMGAPPIVQPVLMDDFCARYTPPIKDFEMLDFEIPSQREYTIESASVAALAIVLTGEGYACDGNGRQSLRGGVAFFVPARTPVVCTSTGTQDLWVCLARSNLHHGRIDDV